MTASGHAMHDAIVIGGGLVGAAIAYGLQRQGLSTVMLDEGDVAHRASRGNFGLVWVQSKGLGAPHYQHWTHASARRGRSSPPTCSQRPASASGCISRGGCISASRTTRWLSATR